MVLICSDSALAQTAWQVFSTRELTNEEKLELILSRNTDAWGNSRRTLVVLHKPDEAIWHALTEEEAVQHWREIAWDLLPLSQDEFDTDDLARVEMAIELTIWRFVRDVRELRGELDALISAGDSTDKLASLPLFRDVQKICRKSPFDGNSLAAKVIHRCMTKRK